VRIFQIFFKIIAQFKINSLKVVQIKLGVLYFHFSQLYLFKNLQHLKFEAETKRTTDVID
jgi:hypothetical protein